MFVAWGLQLAQLHHDACIEILGDMHPTCFGPALRETWAEVISECKTADRSGDVSWQELRSRNPQL